VEAAVAVGELLGQEVVATADPGRAVVDELQHLPVATRVHQAVVDADPVHPRHPLGDGRVVLWVEDHGTAALLGRGDQRGEQVGRAGPSLLRERGQQVAGDGEGQQLDALRQVVEPRAERVVERSQVLDLPVRVDVDDHAAAPSRATALRSAGRRDGRSSPWSGRWCTWTGACG
jgi:hypothetical protein